MQPKVNYFVLNVFAYNCGHHHTRAFAKNKTKTNSTWMNSFLSVLQTTNSYYDVRHWSYATIWLVCKSLPCHSQLLNLIVPIDHFHHSATYLPRYACQAENGCSPDGHIDRWCLSIWTAWKLFCLVVITLCKSVRHSICFTHN